MTGVDPQADLRAQLVALAVRFILPGRLPDVDQAIRLACALIARDLDTPATISVAALSYGTTLRDSEPLIRDMLSEQRVPLASADATDAERFDVVLRAFASGGLSVEEMCTVLFLALPPWEDQTDLQRELLQLTIDLDQETSPEGKAAVIAAMRAVAAGRGAAICELRLVADAGEPPISTERWQALWSLIVHLQPARSATLEGEPPRAIRVESFGGTQVAPGLLADLERLAMTKLRIEVADWRQS